MKKLILLIFLFSVLVSGQTKVAVTLKTEKLSDSTKVFIVGNKPALGNWNPSAVELQRINDSTFSRNFTFNKGDILEFKFTLGDWNKEALDSGNNVPGNNILKVNNDTSVTCSVIKWKNEIAMVNSFKGQITGTVEYYRNMEYKNLLNRDVVIWLPPGYSESKEFYPVLYMHDGQNLFDPATSSFGIDWQIDEAADTLILKNETVPFIIVGIYNTFHRGPEYLPGDTSRVYMNFIVEKLKPFVDKNYRTKPGREFTATGGSSAGGTISFMLLWEHNEVFSKAICMSPAFKFGSIDYVDDVANYSGRKKNIRLYIDNGGVGLEESLQPGVDWMLKTLSEKGYREGEEFVFVKDPEAQHNEAAWAKRIAGALKFIFPGKVTR